MAIRRPPGYGSTANVARLTPDRMEIPHIPVVPIGYGNASELLKFIRGADVPRGWQGWPSISVSRRRRTGTCARRGCRRSRDEAAEADLRHAFGMVRGSEFPEELVIIGGHRDGWGPGHGGQRQRDREHSRSGAGGRRRAEGFGVRPKRTIVFATWDAEEWGLIGSTEYVEDDSLRLSRDAVAYFNQDVAARRAEKFGGGGSPSLRATLRDAARVVADPNGKGSVYAEWRKASAVADTAEPAMGDPGGGSDFAGFYNHLGIPIAEWGFGGQGGVYHSQYDDYNWMTKFGDPGFVYHAAAARVGTAMLLRVANADGRLLHTTMPSTRGPCPDTCPRSSVQLSIAGGEDASTAALRSAIDRFEREGAAFNAARDSALAGSVPSQTLQRTNRALMQVERALIRPQGLRTRPWFRNLIYVADENNGYANMALPSVDEAIRANDETLTRTELDDLAARFNGAAQAVADARTVLRSR